MTVDGLGKISKTTIGMAPLVILVGKNNTGKSYMASLLWGLLNSQSLLLAGTNSKLPEWFAQATHRASNTTEKQRVLLSDENIRELSDFLNDRISHTKSEFIRTIFSSSAVKCGKISVHIRSHDGFVVDFQQLPENAGATATGRGWHEEDGKTAFTYKFNNKEATNEVHTWYLGGIISGLLSGTENGGFLDLMYIPAARTGLMLSLPFVVSQLFETLGIEQSRAKTSALPLPIIRFLQALSRTTGHDRDQEGAKLAAEIEEKILSGSITSSQTPTPIYQYKPSSSEIELPLSLSSSMVTELAPFLILLRKGLLSRGVVFEEPEAHLHLAAQRTLARAIARLVNMGRPVIITTHSDTFLQEINLLLNIHNNKNSRKLQKQLGLSENELLNPEDCRAYEFTEESGKTHVTELKKTEDGFIVPSINDVLFEIAKDITASENAEN